MRWLTSKRLWQVASLVLFGLTLLFTLLWGVRGIRPAVDCGLRDALSRGDLGTAWRCIDLAEYDALLAAIALAGAVLAGLASWKAANTPIGEYNPTPANTPVIAVSCSTG